MQKKKKTIITSFGEGASSFFLFHNEPVEPFMTGTIDPIETKAK